MYRRSLRFRIALSFGGLGALMALLLSVASWLTVERMEAAFLDATLDQELEFFLDAWLRDPTTPPPSTRDIQGLVVALDQIDDQRAELRHLGPGRHETTLDGAVVEIGIIDRAGHRFYLIYDERHIDRAESVLIAFLVGFSLLMTGFSTLLGWLLGGRITAPVRSLADDVRAISAGPTTARLEEVYQADDEVGQLADAFRRAWSRMQGFLERERAFTADASHQLRTSVAVISSTTELLLDEGALPAPVEGRIRRIAHAALSLRRQVEGFLLLARETEAGIELAPCHVDEVVRDLVAREQEALPADGPRLEVVVDAHPVLQAPSEALEIIVGNLVGNAIAHGAGPIEVRVTTDGLEVRDDGPSLSPEVLAQVFDRGYRGPAASNGSGLGLAIAQRIGHRFGWTVGLENAVGSGVVARIRFCSDPSASDRTQRR